MGIEQEKTVRAAFRSITGVGSQRLRQLIACFGSAVKAWEASTSKYLQLPNQEKWIKEVLKARQSIDPQRIGETLLKQGILIITPNEPEYPCLLAELSDAPPLLYYRGQLRGNMEGLAIVGSRKATAYGKAVAKMLARDAASKGIVIASGLARGIDTAAHQGTLEAEGITWAFLGCGLDRIYPQENKRLAEEILIKGALISEFAPGSPPIAAHFPARNRLISGCSQGVVVVEAAERSGALITVDFALEQGREVFAVPGPIFSEVSRGTHHLIRQGAKIVEGIEDICNELPAWSNYAGQITLFKGALPQGVESSDAVESVSEHETILRRLCDVPLHIDQITMNSALSVSAISLALLELQLAGKVTQLPGQHYVLARER
ncbi:DNA-processing protein DprA [Desulfosporosinus nitroreducens]|uniref:DNA-processing protein DprA n=1 Tax=Desulfosporosinus nitroreducens TaxID=2018668 RepID=A0ABT8QW14_9FIRM|nr:DNA-processing protein DprA [Desulfosporosinus nitroreducens]MDO0824835.1 DNA-processing protein DprA [Desulfosporosinus nitroreducens]